MITYNYFGKEQKIYYEKAKSGLDVYVVPNKKNNHYYVELVVRYGSDVEEFIPINEKKYVKIPKGLAHFLEHKVFDMPEGDAIDFFAKKGVYSNASTNFYSTKYYLDGKKHLYGCLDYLLTMTYTPYFMDESINNEREIIAQEIKMYDDEADWELDNYARECTLHNMLKGKIAGTEKSIALIDAQIMKKVHDTFYQPNNMFLIVSGNVDVKKVMQVVQNNKALNEHANNYPIIYKREVEDAKVKEEYKKIRGHIVIPKLKYTFKFDLDSFKFYNRDKLKMYFSILFAILFNEGSSFDETIILKNISSSFYCEHFSYQNIYLFALGAESEYADLFINEVDKVISKINVSLDDFNRIKKVWYSLIIRSIDSASDVAESLASDLIRDTKELDSRVLIDSLNYQEFMNIVNKIDFSNKSLVLMLP